MAEQRTSDTPEGLLLHPDRTREIAQNAFQAANKDGTYRENGWLERTTAARDALVRAGYELAIERLRSGLESHASAGPADPPPTPDEGERITFRATYSGTELVGTKAEIANVLSGTELDEFAQAFYGARRYERQTDEELRARITRPVEPIGHTFSIRGLDLSCGTFSNIPADAYHKHARAVLTGAQSGRWDPHHLADSDARNIIAAAPAPGPALAHTTVPEGGWSCTTPGCSHRSEYAEGPYVCWECKNGGL